MTEKLFRKYGDGNPRPEHRAPIACVVSHPDAGGQCEREAIGEVWALPFCEVHGKEAGLAAQEELAESVGIELEALFDAEMKRYDTNWAVMEALERAEVPTEVGFEALSAAMRAAYPPDQLAANTDPDTLAHDYGEFACDTPHDWWCEARTLLVRFMRQAADRGVPLVRELEYLRERATVQELLAERDMKMRPNPTKVEA